MERENSTRCISRFGNDFLNNAQWFFMDYLFLFNSLQLKVENYLKLLFAPLIKNHRVMMALLSLINIEVSSNYSLISAIPEYGTSIEISRKF